MSGGDSGWLVACDVWLSSYSGDDQIYRPCKEENENDTEFSDSGIGWVPIWGKITLPDLNIGDCDGDNDGEGDEDDADDGYTGIQMIESAELCFLVFSKLKLTNYWARVTQCMCLNHVPYMFFWLHVS